MGRVRSTAVVAVLPVALLTALAGCSTIARPALTVEGVELNGLSAEGVELLVEIKVTNPNDVAAEASGILYTLEMNGVEVLDGRQDSPVSVPAGGSATVSVPVTLRWSSGADALQSILDGGEQRWRLHGRVTVRSGIVTKTFPFSESGTFTTGGPVPGGRGGPTAL
ncbi:MAG: LEA type 2 family protein [Candidatus Eisenbacteria bacterium]|nr:LEA type 2 family protein [Candidatus Eisenbacteria bacterium]